MRQNNYRVLAAALVWAFLAGCGMPAGDGASAPAAGGGAMAQVPPRAADVEGTVKQITPYGDDVTLLVDFAGSSGGTLTDSVRVTPGQTTIAVGQHEQAIPAATSDIAVGSKVKLWYSGPVLESYPRQALAEAVLIEAMP